MADDVADYEGRNFPLDPPGTPVHQAPEPVPPARPRQLALPKNTLLQAGIKRLIWTENPRGTWEVEARATAEPDNGASTGANLDRMYSALKRQADAWIAQLEQEDTAS